MDIEKTEINVRFTVREAQSLLMVLRRVNAVQFAFDVDMHGVPVGAKADVRNLQTDLENILLMDKSC